MGIGEVAVEHTTSLPGANLGLPSSSTTISVSSGSHDGAAMALGSEGTASGASRRSSSSWAGEGRETSTSAGVSLLVLSRAVGAGILAVCVSSRYNFSSILAQ